MSIGGRIDYICAVDSIDLRKKTNLISLLVIVMSLIVSYAVYYFFHIFFLFIIFVPSVIYFFLSKREKDREFRP